MTEMITAYEPVEESLAKHDYEEGDLVAASNDQYDEELGFVLDKHTEDFNWVDPDDPESSVTVEVGDEPVYVVGMAPEGHGASLLTADQLEPRDRDEVLGDMDVDPDPSEAEESMDEEASVPGYDDLDVDAAELVSVADVPGITRNDMGLPPWPESWRESDKPARLIAMDAWVSMGASFRGCRREMVGNVKSPNRICAAWKDAIWGHTYWRG